MRAALSPRPTTVRQAPLSPRSSLPTRASTRTARTGTATSGASASTVRHALRLFSSLIVLSPAIAHSRFNFRSFFFFFFFLFAENKAEIYTKFKCDSEDGDECDCPGWSPAAETCVDDPNYSEHDVSTHARFSCKDMVELGGCSDGGYIMYSSILVDLPGAKDACCASCGKGLHSSPHA